MSGPDGPCGLVLGASGPNSVGWTLAEALRAEGAAVAVTTRPGRVDSLTTAAAAAGFAGLWGVDAGQPPTLDACLDDLSRRWGRLDFLVHTWMHVPEGVLAKPLTAVTRGDFDAAMGPGVFGLIDAVARALPLLEASERARVLTFSSACRANMTPNYHVAGMAKAALSGAVLYLAQELGPKGIACNALSFSFLATGGAERVVGEQAAQATVAHLAKKAPLRGGTSMQAVARAGVWLACHVEGMTAEIVELDGGFSRRYF